MENADMAEKPIGAWRCPTCGTEMAEGTNFCSTCGAPRLAKPDQSTTGIGLQRSLGRDTGVRNCVYDHGHDHDYTDAVQIGEEIASQVSWTSASYDVISLNMLLIFGGVWHKLWAFLVVSLIATLIAIPYRRSARKHLANHDLDNAKNAISIAKQWHLIAEIASLGGVGFCVWHICLAAQHLFGQ